MLAVSGRSRRGWCLHRHGLLPAVILEPFVTVLAPKTLSWWKLGIIKKTDYFLSILSVFEIV